MCCKKMPSVFMAFFMAFPCLCNAQNTAEKKETEKKDTLVLYDIFDKLSETSHGGGKVTLAGDDIKSIINDTKNVKKQLKGYRIRIFRDNSQTARQKAENIKANIGKEYPSLPIYITHNSPDFHVEVGDFRNHDEAEKTKRTLINSYPEATLVNVNINFPPL
jgi:hypothetical protein